MDRVRNEELSRRAGIERELVNRKGVNIKFKLNYYISLFYLIFFLAAK